VTGAPATRPFIRTVLGDIAPAELGVTYAHEHLIIDGGRAVELDPGFDLADVDAIATEVGAAAELGLGAVVDAMPIDAGRNVEKLATVSRRTGVHVVAATGLHHARFYPAGHWSERATAEEIAARFVADIEDGCDDDGTRTTHRAGVIKIAGSDDGPSDRDGPIFGAAAIAHRTTGAPILTHCERGTGALEQVATLSAGGVSPQHVVLSHVDKVVDRGYHRAIAATGAVLEYDGSFRWGDGANGTLRLLEWMAEDGLLGQVVLGMDAARRSYLSVYGGRPGLTWLLDGFSTAMEGVGLGAEIRRRLLVENPARVFAFADRSMEGASR